MQQTFSLFLLRLSPNTGHVSLYPCGPRGAACEAFITFATEIKARAFLAKVNARQIRGASINGTYTMEARESETR